MDTRSPSLPPALMLQGTCSNAGKSLLTAALGRLLARRGLNVAPFKAQNMALNSHVTAQGQEMGRAQAVQAIACGLEPDVRMNPVLLKPTSQCGSQVIVLGKAVGQMQVREYLAYKPVAWRAVRRAYAELAAGRDVMLLEGAGSPAEINLRAHDIVNMRMARHAGAQVLLVADIDRGGAFAALAGTMSLLGRADRARVAGYLLNKFRGDASLLGPALEAVSRRTRRPFLGVVPMLEDLQLPEEDSVSFRLGLVPGLSAGGHGPEAGPESGAEAGASSGLLDVALLDVPHISNFTDMDALRAEPAVRLRRVRRPEELGHPALLILPGSKNSPADMDFLWQTGLAGAVRDFAARCLASGRGMLAGICGGMQMLGAHIADPLGLEAGGERPGLGLLPLVSELVAEKRLCRVEGLALAPLLEGASPLVQGYEIHHGRTRVQASGTDEGTACVVLRDRAGQALGWGRCGADGRARVWGSYLHGIFDADDFRHRLLAGLRAEFGLPPVPGVAFSIGPELDRLADAVEAAVDMPALEALLGL